VIEIGESLWWVVVQFDFDVGEPAQYALVLGEQEDPKGGPPTTVADPDVGSEIARMILRRQQEPGTHGTLAGRSQPFSGSRRIGVLDSRPMGAEQSNSSSVVADRWVLKMLRRVEPGIHPEVEIMSHLNAVGFPNVPEMVGTLEYVPNSALVGTSHNVEPATVATMVGFIRIDDDAYAVAVNQAAQFLEWAATLRVEDMTDAYAPSFLVDAQPPEWLAIGLGEALAFAELLGQRTAELHQALAKGVGQRLQPLAYNAHARRSTYQAIRTEVKSTTQAMTGKSGRGLIDGALAHRLETAVLQRCEELIRRQIDGHRIRIHGDLHLGQILVRGGDITFIDFEGEPGRPLGERSIKRTPLVDVAGMVRSFDYAANQALRDAVERGTGSTEALEPWARVFESWDAHRFVQAYVNAIDGAGILPSARDDVELLLDVAVIQKAAYEVRYEIGHRPDRVSVPLAALERIVGVQREPTLVP